MNVAEIKSKYLGDVAGMEVKVDVEAMRSAAKDALNEANRMVAEHKRKESLKAAGKEPFEDLEWNKRWKKSQADRIKEQKRSVTMAIKMLDEILVILGKAEETIADVK
jgi:hypothetical protein